MGLDSDVAIKLDKFDRGAVKQSTININKQLESAPSSSIKWWKVGAPAFRQMKELGENGFSKPVEHPSASDFEIPSRQSGRMIPCRPVRPDNIQLTGIYMHMHAGGWVYNTHRSQDHYLASLARQTSMLVVSVGYRLAPEHTFPCGPEDCYDVAEWLVDEAVKNFGVPLRVVAGESAGAHLAVFTLVHLLSSRPAFKLSGLVANCGIYDLTLLPQVNLFKRPKLVLDGEAMKQFTDAFLLEIPADQRKRPDISPLYIDFDGLELPPALFTCGTEDCLLDDTLFMGLKWRRTGTKTFVKLYPGGCHAFQLLEPISDELATIAMSDLSHFLNEELR